MIVSYVVEDIGAQELLNIHAAPIVLASSTGLSPGPPIMAVVPSAEIHIDEPWSAWPTAPAPINLLPCCVQTVSERVKTHTAPLL